MHALNGMSVKGSKMRVKKADPAAKKDETPEEAASAVPSAVDAAAQATEEAAARAKLKKDGSALGMKKPRTFRKTTK